LNCDGIAVIERPERSAQVQSPPDCLNRALHRGWQPARSTDPRYWWRLSRT
jgi:hypothetical protein